VGATAGGGVIVPGPACGNVDLEGNPAAEALAGGYTCGGCGFGHCLSSRHCERSEAIQSLAAEAVWIASLRSQ
jgi:hypothetical protein